MPTTPPPTRTRAPATVQPVAKPEEELIEVPGTPVETRPATYDTGREDGRSEMQEAVEAASSEEYTDEEMACFRQERNMEFWRMAFCAALAVKSEKEAITTADRAVKEFDRRFEGGWFAHQHESFFEEAD